MKIIKKLIIIFLILLIQSINLIYKILSKFWSKYKQNIKSFIKKLDIELREAIQ